MPRRDGTGPEGRGSMTGRGMDTCNEASSNFAGEVRYGIRGGRGLGRKYGAGFRFNNDNNNYTSLCSEINELKEKVDTLTSHLDGNK